MDYIDYKRFIRNALKNKAYLPTYAAFGTGAVLALIYMTDWETVGRHVPIWKYHFPPLPPSTDENNANGTASTT